MLLSLFLCLNFLIFLIESKTLVVYSGPISSDCDLGNSHHRIHHRNFVYFLEHGLVCEKKDSYPSSDNINYKFVIVLTEVVRDQYESQLVNYVNNCNNIIFMERSGHCYDMESYRLALNTMTTSQIEMYSSFIFLNCGILGPLSALQHKQPTINDLNNVNNDKYRILLQRKNEINKLWIENFISHINDKVKLVGISMNCKGQFKVKQAHVQSMIWATDLEGLNLIRVSGAIYDCGKSLEKGTFKDKMKARKELINKYELGLSAVILEKGYLIKSLHPKQQLLFHSMNSTKNYPTLCRDIWDRNDKIMMSSYSNIYQYKQKDKHKILPEFWKNTRRGLERPPGIKDWELSWKGNQKNNPCSSESPWELTSQNILR